MIVDVFIQHIFQIFSLVVFNDILDGLSFSSSQNIFNSFDKLFLLIHLHSHFHFLNSWFSFHLEFDAISIQDIFESTESNLNLPDFIGFQVIDLDSEWFILHVGNDDHHWWQILRSANQLEWDRNRLKSFLHKWNNNLSYLWRLINHHAWHLDTTHRWVQ